MALLAAACLYATELNIYASGLKVHQTASGATIDYMLNAPATSLNVYIYGSANTLTPAKTIDLSTDAANLTKGAHTGVAIDLSGLADAVYTWAIEAGAEAHATDVTVVSDITVAGSRGMTYNDKVESPYFGMFYLADNKNGGTGGYILAVTPDLAQVDTLATGWGVGASSPMRILIAEDDMLFVTDWSDKNPNVSIVNPAVKNGTITPVFGADHTDADGVAYTSENVAIHGSIAGGCVLGTGANRVLYTMDEDVKVDGKMVIFAYNIGEAATPWIEAPSSVVFPNTENYIQNANVNFFPDGHDGWWIAQHRWEDASAVPSLAHITAAGTVDFHSAGEITAAGYNSRGSIFVTNDKQYVVTSADANAKIWKPYFTGDVLDSLVLFKTVALTGITNIYDILLDPAGNVYALKDVAGTLTAVATATENNVFKTPAPASEYISLPCVDNLYEIGSNQGWATNAGVAMTKIATNVFEKEFVFSSGSTVYFTFTSNLSENWNELNLYGATTHDEGISPALSPRNLVSASENSFAIASGRYKITADLNTMKVTVEELAPVVSIAGSDGMGNWSTTANVLVEADDHLTASKTIHLTPNMYNFKVVLNHYIWNTDHNAPANNTETAPTEMNRANCTGWVFDQGDGYKDTRLRVDLEGDYEFVYTYATKELSISGFPISFTRTVTAEDADKYQTLCVPFDATVSGATVYEFDGATETGVTLNAVASDALEAGKSYLILPEGAGSIVVSAIPAGDVAGAPEELHGLSGFYGILGADYEYVFADNDFATYVLQDDNKFHKIIGDASATITTTHAYLHIAGGITAPALRIIMGATNIENVEDVEQAVKFIQNGQMFIKKNGVTYDALGRVVR